MNNKLIEQAAKSELIDSLIDAGIFSSYISDNDKEPSWDGFIYIHNNKNLKKENIVGRIPIQLKGHEDSNLNKIEVTFYVERVDLQNYLKDNGIILFVVYINKNNHRNRKVYFETLTPVKLNLKLSSTKKTKKVPIKLKVFPSDPNMQELILRNFLTDSKKQISHIHNDNIINIDLNNLNNKTLSVFTHVPKDVQKNVHSFVKILNSTEVYFYVNDDNKNLIPTNIFTSSEFKFGVISYPEDCPVSINGKIYYKSVEVSFFNKEKVIKIGESFKIITVEGDSQIRLKFQLSSSLKHSIADLSFIIDILKNENTFFVRGDEFNFSVHNYNLVELENKLYDLNRIDLLFSTLNIVDDLDLAQISDIDSFQLEVLIKGIVDKENVNISFDSQSLQSVVCFEICNLKIQLIAIKNTDGTYFIQDFFTPGLVASQERKVGEGERIVSPFTLLDKDDYITISNINYEVILNSYKNLGEYDYIYQLATMDMLKMLLAYDIKPNQKLYDLIKELSIWILKKSNENIPSEVVLLNHLQIIKRERDFDDDEKMQLVELADNTELHIKLGANILLGDTIRSRSYFNKLDEQTQNLFKAYPIYKFYQE